jgi:hypothetical protein
MFWQHREHEGNFGVEAARPCGASISMTRETSGFVQGRRAADRHAAR